MHYLKPIKAFVVEHPLWVLLGICVLGLALRLINIGAEPYWGDEILSLDISTHFTSMGELVNYLKQVEFHPPLFYILVHYWAMIFGTSELSVRMISVIFGIGTIVLTYVLSQKLFKNNSGALIAALLIAVLPMHIEYSQEARPYAIFTFFGLLNAIAVWDYWQTRKAKNIIIYICSGIVGLYLHYSFGFILAATAIWWLINIFTSSKDRFLNFTRLVLVVAVISLAFSFWLPALLYKINLAGIELLGLTRDNTPQRETLFTELILDQLVWSGKVKYIDNVVILIKFLAKIIFVGSLIFVAAKSLVWNKNNPAFKKLTFLSCLFFIPFILFLFSPYSVPYTDIRIRHLLFLLFPMVLSIGWLLTRLNAKMATAMLLFLILSFVPYTSEVVANDQLWDPEHNVKATAEIINRLYEPGDIVLIIVAPARTNLNHYLRPELSAIPIMPSRYFGGEYGSTRQTLGFIENDFQTRLHAPSEEEIDWKMDEIYKLYKPKRIWLAGVQSGNYKVHGWFAQGNWRHGFKPIGEVIYLDLYAQQ